MPRKILTTAQVIDSLKRCYPLGWENIDLGSVVYTGALNPMSLTCKLHGEFHLRRAGIAAAGPGYSNRPFACPTCYQEAYVSQLQAEGKSPGTADAHYGKRRTEDEWIARFRQAHGDCYQYPQPFEYQIDEKNKKRKVRMLCPEHGVFYQRAEDHARGSRCPGCRYSTNTKARAL